HLRERFPAQFGVGDTQRRVVELEPGASVLESLPMEPVRRGMGEGGRLYLRLPGPWGLAWRQGIRELPWSVTVYPSLQTAATRGLPNQSRRRREAGQRAV